MASTSLTLHLRWWTVNGFVYFIVGVGVSIPIAVFVVFATNRFLFFQGKGNGRQAQRRERKLQREQEITEHFGNNPGDFTHYLLGRILLITLISALTGLIPTLISAFAQGIGAYQGTLLVNASRTYYDVQQWLYVAATILGIVSTAIVIQLAGNTIRVYRQVGRYVDHDLDLGISRIPVATIARAVPAAVGTAQDEIDVYMYIDTNDIATVRRVVEVTDQLVDLLGFDGPFDTQIEFGSWIRRSTARIRKGLTSSEAKQRLAELEQAAALYAVDEKQAKVDTEFAKVLSSLIDALKDVPNACVRAGSTVVIKYEVNGKSVIQSRKLTPSEMRLLDRYPEIQNNPSAAIEALGLAIGRLEEDKN